jgi:hypothetical protein
VWASNAAEGAAPNFQLLQTFPQASDVFGGRQPAKQADEHTPLVSICGCADAAGQPVLLASQNDSKVITTARCTRLRIVTILGFGTGCDREWPLNDGQIPNVRVVRVHCEYALQPRRWKSAGVAKRPRERSLTRNPPIRHLLLHRCR